jgi:hypothetical protein
MHSNHEANELFSPYLIAQSSHYSLWPWGDAKINIKLGRCAVKIMLRNTGSTQIMKFTLQLYRQFIMWLG